MDLSTRKVPVAVSVVLALLTAGVRADAADPGSRQALGNRDLAAARASLLEQKGGEGTGGMLGADDIVVIAGGVIPEQDYPALREAGAGGGRHSASTV